MDDASFQQLVIAKAAAAAEARMRTQAERERDEAYKARDDAMAKLTAQNADLQRLRGELESLRSEVSMSNVVIGQFRNDLSGTQERIIGAVERVIGEQAEQGNKLASEIASAAGMMITKPSGKVDMTPLVQRIDRLHAAMQASPDLPTYEMEVVSRDENNLIRRVILKPKGMP